ncbi:hypothetical protein AX17_001839 [Amanita inopinata Kibby_2008]|nr:hypothetical protein AX17_001839 [Amanita inopinata Kibby_2008]
MALTLPVEELARLQVTFKLSLPDDILTFEMFSNSNTSSPLPQTLSGYKLHLKGSRDGSGLCLKVWAQYDVASQPRETAPEIFDDVPTPALSERTESQSPQSSEDSSSLDTSFDLDGDIGGAPGHDVDRCGKMTEPTWYQCQNGGGSTQLSDALAYIESLDGFDNNNWFKTDASTELFGNVMDVASPPQVSSHFDKQVSFGYQGCEQSATYVPFFPAANGLCERDGHFSSCIPHLDSSVTPESGCCSTSDDAADHDASVKVSSPDADAQGALSQMVSPEHCQRPYQCLEPSCDRWFKRDYTRKVHMLTHRRNKDKKPFRCSLPGCPERFSRKHDRLRHEVGRHGLESEWNCQPCHRFFSSRATMERHIFDKHGDVAINRSET